jgi:hypothetical protein
MVTVPAVVSPSSLPPAQANGYDPVTGCTEDVAGDISVNRAIAFQRVVNAIPENVVISRWQLTDNEGTRTIRDDDYRLVTPKDTPINLGQQTPYMEKDGTVKNYKYNTAGSYEEGDHWWSGNRRGCDTNIPLLIEQGRNRGVKAWTYGNTEFRPNEEKWYAFPRQTHREGPKTYVTFVCRGPREPGTNALGWDKKNSQPGFETSTTDPKGGIAPACADSRFENVQVRHQASLSKMGNLQAPGAEFIRDCEVRGGASIVGCWQEVWKGPWYRTWRFETYVYAVAMRAVMESRARILVPAEFTENNISVERNISWRIVDARVLDGRWPKGNRDFGGPAPDTRAEWAKPSPYTIPGNGQAFRISAWGNPKNAKQEMSFRLIADTDGTWTWPVNPDTGRELERPETVLRLGFTLGNFNNFTASDWSCRDGAWVDSTQIGSTPDSRHCISGSVPTPYEEPTENQDRERRRHNTAKPTFPVEGNTTFFTNVPGNWNSSQLKVNIIRTETSSEPNADLVWQIRISGLIDTAK